jgi:hypothetical protein
MLACITMTAGTMEPWCGCMHPLEHSSCDCDGIVRVKMDKRSF